MRWQAYISDYTNINDFTTCTRVGIKKSVSLAASELRASLAEQTGVVLQEDE